MKCCLELFCKEAEKHTSKLFKKLFYDLSIQGKERKFDPKADVCDMRDPRHWERELTGLFESPYAHFEILEDPESVGYLS